jgi:hypothetical protein
MAIATVMGMLVGVLREDMSPGVLCRGMRVDMVMAYAGPLDRMQSAVSEKGQSGVKKRQEMGRQTAHTGSARDSITGR